MKKLSTRDFVLLALLVAVLIDCLSKMRREKNG